MPLPDLGRGRGPHSGLGAEIAVARELEMHRWHVQYVGNRQLPGYDLLATREGVVLRVEVKSSVGFTTPELTESEWRAANDHAESFALAVVDFYGSDRQNVWYVRDPAAGAQPTLRQVTVYRFPRAIIEDLRTEVDFL